MDFNQLDMENRDPNGINDHLKVNESLYFEGK